MLSAIGLVFLYRSHGVIKLVYGISPSLLCSICLAIYPQSLTYAVWLLSYLIMWSSVVGGSYPITIPMQGVISIFKSPFEAFHGKLNKNHGNSYVVISIIVLIFLVLYVKSNPVFSDLFSKIDLSFIEFGFIMMIFGMYLLLYGLASIKKNKSIDRLNSLKQTIEKTILTDKVEQEFKIAKLSIWIVAFLLLLANGIDLVILFTGKLPEDMTYSEYVHQGFNTLIFTLSLAIGLIFYFFRGQINFHNKVQHLKKASFLWISQNLLLALITAYKNLLYVQVYGLTYKRIAVFLALICVIIGIILSLKKIKEPFTNWFYFNKLSLYAFICSIIISFIPFDKLITAYNLTNSETVDIEYILSLDKPDLEMIYNYIDESDFVNPRYKYEFKNIIKNKLQRLSEQSENANWQSWSIYMKNNR